MLQEFVWLGGTLVAVLTNSTTAEPRVYYAYSDHLNAPRVIVNAVGDVRWRWISEPFGTTAAETIPNSLENLVVNLRFPGQYFDKESGLNYNYFRDYDGTTGRYTQVDPIGLDGGVNTYAYGNGNPLTYIDPYGLFGWADMPDAPAWLVDGAAGFGDSLSFGATGYIRSGLGIGGVNNCSRAYRNGELADLAFEVGTMGVSAGLKALAKNASRKAVYAEARAATKGIDRMGGQLHHDNPLFGHPGFNSPPSVFPTGGLPASIHSSPLNLTLMGSRAEHLAAHERLKALEAWVQAFLMNPPLTGARAARDLAQGCGCP